MSKKMFRLLSLVCLAVMVVVAVYLKESARQEQRTLTLREDPAEKAKKSGKVVIAEFGQGI